MTVRELASVMGNQFIAVGREVDKNISWCGSANKFSSWLSNREVVEVIAPKDMYSATVIYVK